MSYIKPHENDYYCVVCDKRHDKYLQGARGFIQANIVCKTIKYSNEKLEKEYNAKIENLQIQISELKALLNEFMDRLSYNKNSK